MATETASTVALVPLAGPGTHVPALDGVRGLAILLVLIMHLMLFNNNNGNRWMDALSQLQGLCGAGVDLFFVLSGFLITGILYDTLHGEHYFRNFYMRRFLRIFPLYYGFLFLLLALTPWLHVTWGGRQFVLLAYLQNTAIWFPVSGFHPSLVVDLNHFWSLAVEEQFYCVWPLVVFLVRDRKRLMQLALGLSACALALRIALATYSTALASGIVHEWTLCRMDTLMLGGVLALWLRGDGSSIRSAERHRMLLAIFFWAAVLLISVYAAIHPRVAFGYGFFGATYGGTLLALAFAVLIFLSIQPGTLWNRFFSVAWLRSLGKYSYGMYVLHILVGYLLSTTIRKWLGTSLRIWLTPRLHSRPAAILVEFAVSVSVVYAAAWLSYNLYEVRFLRLKRRFAA